MTDKMADNRQGTTTVLVTGFGPFGSHSVNASSVAVKELAKKGLGIPGAMLITDEISVDYQVVEKEIPQLWEKYKPQLCVHVGVHGMTEQLLLETCAHNPGYDKPDICGQCPLDGCCVEGATECLETSLDLKRVCKEIKAKGCPCSVDISHDAGRYLCEFIFYRSLQLGLGTVAFIHVPPLDSPYSKTELAEALKIIITAMVQQLNLSSSS